MNGFNDIYPYSIDSRNESHEYKEATNDDSNPKFKL